MSSTSSPGWPTSCPASPSELISSALNVDDPLQLVYAVATYVRIDLEEAQRLLELDSCR